MSKLESIEELQSAESKAKEMIDRANLSKSTKIQKADENAAGIIEEAEASAIEIKKNYEKELSEKLELERKRRLEEAHLKANRIRDVKLSDAKARMLVGRIVKEIMGAK